MNVFTFIIYTLASFTSCSSHIVFQIDEEYEEKADIALETSDLGDFSLRLTAYGQQSTLKLTPAADIFANDVKTTFQIDAVGNLEELDELQGTFYVDETSRASVYIENVNGQYQIDGVVDELRIRNADGQHVFSKFPKRDFDCSYSKDDDSKPPPIDLLNFNKMSFDDTSSNDIANIEVLVLLDKNVYNHLHSKNYPVKKYLGIFYNYVQNAYANITDPKVEFTIVGIHILHDLNWAAEARLSEENVFNVDEMLDKMDLWLYQQEDLPNFDIALLHTTVDLAGVSRSGQVNKGVAGVASLKGVCQEYPLQHTVRKGGIVEDVGAPLFFAGFAAAHEIAHLLSARHDDETNCAEIGIMHSHGRNTYWFSKCSIESIRNHLKSDSAKCVFSKANPTAPLVKAGLPVVSRDEICKIYGEKGFDTAFPVDSYNRLSAPTNPCEKVFCQKSGSSSLQGALLPLADGIECGSGKVCRRMVCVRHIPTKNRDMLCKGWQPFPLIDYDKLSPPKNPCEHVVCVDPSNPSALQILTTNLEGYECDYGRVCKDSECVPTKEGEPVTEKPDGGDLPPTNEGKETKSRNEMCKERSLGPAIGVDEYGKLGISLGPCENIVCRDPKNPLSAKFFSPPPNLDGFECGSGKICSNNECIPNGASEPKVPSENKCPLSNSRDTLCHSKGLGPAIVDESDYKNFDIPYEPCKTIVCSIPSKPHSASLLKLSDMDGFDCGTGKVCCNEKCVESSSGGAKGPSPNKCPSSISRSDICKKHDTNFSPIAPEKYGKYGFSYGPCEKIACTNPSNPTLILTVSVFPNLDGYECGSGKECKNNGCVPCK